MNYLLICTYYPPDTTIASIRPYMLAKYLYRLGNEVTVIRSGHIEKTVDSFFETDPNIRVISYDGEDEILNKEGKTIENKIRLPFLSYKKRLLLWKISRVCIEPIEIYKVFREMNRRFEKQKCIINLLSNEHFDIVFSTYGEMENMLAGEYASQVFKCKWIMDFRDPVRINTRMSLVRRLSFYKYEQRALKNPDLCTVVSDGMRKNYENRTDKQIITLYNGYEDTEIPEIIKCDNLLSLCYTGQIVSYRQKAAVAFISVISRLIQENRINRNKIRFVYAGADDVQLREEFDSAGLIDIFDNKGYLPRKEVLKLQLETDIFMLFSWNLPKEEGILTGKFYEGVRSRKPILSIVAGSKPYSELNDLCDKYHYGFCYETSRKSEQFDSLCNWIEDLYNQKMKNGKIEYIQNKEFEEMFNYQTIASKLDNLCQSLIK